MTRSRIGVLLAAVVVSSWLAAPTIGGHQPARDRLTIWSATSQPLGSDFRISGLYVLGDQEYPAIAYNSTAGEYLVVWQDSRELSTRGKDIYGRRVSASGSVLGDDFRISGVEATADEWWPAVAYNSRANEYLLVWADTRFLSTSGWTVYGQRLSAAGGAIGASFRISGGAAKVYHRWPAVAYGSGSDEYLVVWPDDRNYAGKGTDVFGQRLSSAGVRRGVNFEITGAAATGNDSVPALAYNASRNHFLVVWSDGRRIAAGGSTMRIYGQRLAASSAPLGHNFAIAPPDPRSQWFPAVAYSSASSRYLVVWQEIGADIEDRIAARLVSASGPRIGDPIQVSPPSIAPAMECGVAYSPSADQFLVAWSDWRNSLYHGADIYGRTFSTAGSVVGSDFVIGFTDTDAPRHKYTPRLAYSPATDSFLVVWGDRRDYPSRGYDIYGRRVSAASP